MNEGVDRRRHGRAQLHATVHGTAGLSSNLRVVDLSPAGARVEHAHDLSPGRACVLDLHLNGVEVHLRAHVAWCQLYSVGSDPDGAEEVRYRSGLAFTDLRADVVAHLQEYLATLKMPTSDAARDMP